MRNRLYRYLIIVTLFLFASSFIFAIDNYVVNAQSSVIIWAWDSRDNGVWVSVPITMDGAPTGYNTPHTFTVSGTHSFTVPLTDGYGTRFSTWDSGPDPLSLTIWRGEGTYTARYNSTPYDLTLKAWDPLGWASVPITMDSVPTGYNTPHTFTGLKGLHVFNVPNTEGLATYSFDTWSGYEYGRVSLSVCSAGTYTAQYGGALPPYSATIWGWDNVHGWLSNLPISMNGAPTGYYTPHTFTNLIDSRTFSVPDTNSYGTSFKNWSTGETTTSIKVSYDGIYTAQYYHYDVTIWAWDSVHSWLNNMRIAMDYSFTDFYTPHTFTGLSGTHTFGVSSTDSFGNVFGNWSTGWTGSTITVSSEGTYTAQYYPYTVTIWAWDNAQGWLNTTIIMDGAPTIFGTPHTFTGLSGVHTFAVPSVDIHGNPFRNWTTGDASTTITVASGGTYTAQYYELVKYKLQVIASNSGLPSVPFLADYTSGEIFYYDELHTTPWSINVDAGTTASIHNAPEIVSGSSGVRWRYLNPDLPHTVTMGASRTVTLSYRRQVEITLAVSPTGSGTITAGPSTLNIEGKRWYDAYNQMYNIQANANPGYKFKEWTASNLNIDIDNSSSPETQFTAGGPSAGPGDITAVFELAPYSATIWTWDSAYGWPEEPVTKDGIASGFKSPHNFTGLTGTHTFTVPSTDEYGNSFVKWATGETSTTITVTSEGTYTAQYFKSPTGSIVINGGAAFTTSTSATLSLNYTAYGSTVSQVRLSNEVTWDSEVWESPAASRAWVLTSGDGTKTVYYQIRDSAGLLSITYSDTITLDTSNPQGSIQINKGADYTNATTVSLTLLATDAGSGISQMRFSNDGATYSSWELYATSKSWSLVGGPGTKYVYVQFKDRVDLTVAAYGTIVLDTMLPVANAGQNQNAQIGQTVTFSGSGSTDNIGIASYSWDFGDSTTGTGATVTHTYSNVGTYTVSLMVKDLAGNSATNSSTVSVDVAVPEFPPTAMLLLFVMFASALASGLKRKRMR